MRTPLSRSTLRFVPAIATLSLAAASAAPLSGHDLTRVLVGNSLLAAAVRATFADPSRPGGAGAPAVAATSHPLRSLQDAVADGATPPDLVLMPLPDIALACAQDLVRSLPGNANCARPAFKAGLVLADDPARDGDSPRWADFWDVARRPGRRGLPRQARGTLELALLADGVPPGEIYRTLGTDAGATRAFRKLEQLRPYVEWWTDGLAARRALQSGGVLMTTLPLSAVDDPSASAATLAVDADGVLAEDLGWAVPVAAAHAAAALDLLGRVDADSGVLASRFALRAAAMTATRSSAGSPRPLLTVDTVFWRDHQALDARFRAWLAS